MRCRRRRDIEGAVALSLQLTGQRRPRGPLICWHGNAEPRVASRANCAGCTATRARLPPRQAGRLL